MKYLIVVEHGYGEKDGKLNSRSIYDLKDQGNHLKENFLNNKKTIIFSSPVPLALNTAVIIGCCLSIGIEEIKEKGYLADCLNYHPQDQDNKILELIKSRSEEAVVLVTHGSIIKSLIPSIRQKLDFKEKYDCNYQGMEKLFIIDCEKEEIRWTW